MHHPSSMGNDPDISSEYSEYTKEDIAKWQQGAQKFRLFWEKIKDKEVSIEDIGNLQAMFFGEKPTYFGIPANPVIQSALTEAGFKIIGDYAYDLNQVAAVIKKNPRVFTEYGDDPIQVMTFLDSADIREHHTARGLVLGTPLSSIKNYEYKEKFKIHAITDQLYALMEEGSEEKQYFLDNIYCPIFGRQDLIEFIKGKLKKYQQKLQLNDIEMEQLIEEFKYLINGKHFYINGITWVDYGDMEESLAREERLKAAFHVFNTYL